MIFLAKTKLTVRNGSQLSRVSIQLVRCVRGNDLVDRGEEGYEPVVGGASGVSPFWKLLLPGNFEGYLGLSTFW